MIPSLALFVYQVLTPVFMVAAVLVGGTIGRRR